MESKQLQTKYCNTLGCEVVLQNEKGTSTCLSSHLCKSNECEERHMPVSENSVKS